MTQKSSNEGQWPEGYPSINNSLPANPSPSWKRRYTKPKGLQRAGEIAARASYSVYDHEIYKKQRYSHAEAQETPLQQYKNYVKARINLYSEKALRLRRIHNVLQILTLIGAALVSVIINIPEVSKLIPTLVGGFVTIAVALANYYRPGERSRDLYRTVEDMQQEYNWFKSKRGPYRNLSPEAAFDTFQERIDILKREQFLHSFAFGEQKREDTHTAQFKTITQSEDDWTGRRDRQQ